ncbi:MAG: histidine kinase [Bacteroidetes bacterium]|nr:histidine kinase [Bacteroidota bacterium]
MIRILRSLFLRNALLLLFIEACIFISLLLSRPLSYILVPLLFMAVTYGVVFLFNHFAVRLLLLRKKLAIFGTTLLLYLIAVSFLLWGGMEGFKEGQWLWAFVNCLLVQLTGSGLYFIFLWVKDNYIRTGEQLRQKQDELHLLHLQMNPHFLMNALNNLYGISLSAPDQVPGKIVELSELLRYQVNATRRERVKLDEEIEFLEKFIAHQQWKSRQLRGGLRTTGIRESVEIPPLLGLPLLENAIKFALETPEPYFEIAIDYRSGVFTVSLTNSCLAPAQRKNGTGLGLVNLKQRLQLSGLRHELSSHEKEPSMYFTELKLWI